MTGESRRIERDQYVRMMCRQMPGVVWTTDRNLSITYLAGRSADNMPPVAKPGTTLFDVFETHDPTHPVIAHHRAALAGESQSFEYLFKNRWYAVFIEQLTNDAGDVLGCIASAFDVTEQRATQRSLARSEALLAQSQRMAHVGSFEWDIPANVLTSSDELCRIYGLEPGQFPKTYDAYLEHVHRDDVERVKSIFFDALRKAGPVDGQHRIVRP